MDRGRGSTLGILYTFNCLDLFLFCFWCVFLSLPGEQCFRGKQQFQGLNDSGKAQFEKLDDGRLQKQSVF